MCCARGLYGTRDVGAPQRNRGERRSRPVTVGRRYSRASADRREKRCPRRPRCRSRRRPIALPCHRSPASRASIGWALHRGVNMLRRRVDREDDLVAAAADFLPVVSELRTRERGEKTQDGGRENRPRCTKRPTLDTEPVSLCLRCGATNSASAVCCRTSYRRHIAISTMQVSSPASSQFGIAEPHGNLRNLVCCRIIPSPSKPSDGNSGHL